MMKKKLLALLMLSAMIVPSIKAADNLALANSSVQTQTEISTEDTGASAVALRTALRCALLSSTKNATKVYGNYKLGFFKSPDYVGHVVTYLLNEFIPNPSSSTVVKMAEWASKEISFVKEKDDTGKDLDAPEWNLKQDYRAKAALRIFLKAGSRKQWFLPDGSSTREVLKSPLGAVMMPFAEGLLSDKFKADVDSSAVTFKGTLQEKAVDRTRAYEMADTQLTGAKISAPAINAMRPAAYAYAGRLADGMAEDLLLVICTNPVCPGALLKFLESDNGFELAKNLLSQLIEDSINEGISKATK